MCFKAPQVFGSTIDYLVKTIVTVLHSSVSCEVLMFENEETLQIGSSILPRDCLKLIEMCNAVIQKLEGHEVLASSLLHAVVRVAVSTSFCQFSFQFPPTLEEKEVDERSVAFSKLHCHLPRECSLQNHEIPLRLLFWYLDPASLQHDISKILQDAVTMPFLCLSNEFHKRMDWRNLVICLALSPVMFIETRALLHNWFLMTGFAFILEFLVALISVILDLLSRPTWWGIPMDLGFKLPLSDAYFPCQSHLLRTLAGPLFSEKFVHLVHVIGSPISGARKQSASSFKRTGIKLATINQNSLWALAVNFPDWFYFASILLFSGKSFQDHFQPKCMIGAPKNRGPHDSVLLSQAAARYIAWVMSPLNKSNQDLLVGCLIKISEAWTRQQFGPGVHDKKALGCDKLKKHKFHGSKDYNLTKVGNSKMIDLWLREFQSTYLDFAKEAFYGSASRETNASCGHSLHEDLLVRGIPLGVLVGCPNSITDDGCELLLHYAATGRIGLMESKFSGSKHAEQISEFKEGSNTQAGMCNTKREAIAGACLAFRLTDIVQSMSASFFENQEIGQEYIYQVKLKASKYLIKCIKRLIQLGVDEDGPMLLMGLHDRLLQWRHQGKEVIEVNKDLDDITSDLSHKLSLL